MELPAESGSRTSNRPLPRSVASGAGRGPRCGAAWSRRALLPGRDPVKAAMASGATGFPGPARDTTQPERHMPLREDEPHHVGPGRNTPIADSERLMPEPVRPIGERRTSGSGRCRMLLHHPSRRFGFATALATRTFDCWRVTAAVLAAHLPLLACERMVGLVRELWDLGSGPNFVNVSALASAGR